MSLKPRRFGVELEMVLPDDSSFLPAGPTPYDRVAGFLRKYGVPAMSQDEAKGLTRGQGRDKIWIVKADSSIVSGKTGIEGVEITTPIMSGEPDLQRLRQVAGLLQVHGFATTDQTALHVHHEADDLGLDDWKRLMLNYALAEPSLDRLMDQNRRGNANIYAVSTRPTGSVDGFLERLYDAQNLDDIKSAIFLGDDLHDLTKLNVDAFVLHGTVEFRHHHGTLDPDAIEHWVRLSQSFVEHAVHHPAFLSARDGIIDPKHAFQVSADPDERVQDQLLASVISLAGPDTRQHYVGVLYDREKAVSAIIAAPDKPSFSRPTVR